MKKYQYLLFGTLLLLISTLSSTAALAQSRMSYKVIVNPEEQFSIWPLDKALPANWKDTRFSGSHTLCQNHIKEVWTDMRPLSVRKR